MPLTPSITRASLPGTAASAGTLAEGGAGTVAGKAADVSIQRLHHHAFYCENSEVTRHFYEDILGLPLTMTVVLEDDIEFFKGRYCHTFFGLADGSAIAFFDYPALRAERVPEYRNAFEHHLALRVDNDQVLEHYQARLQQAGVECTLIDHQVFKSLYFKDPNGLNLELCTNTSITREVEDRALQTAHDDLRRWMDEQGR